MMQIADIFGVWKLKSFFIGQGSDLESWKKDGILIMTEDGYFSMSINYLGDVLEDRNKKYTKNVIRDYFAAGKYKIVDHSTMEMVYLNHSMPERINLCDKKFITIKDSLLQETLSRGAIKIELTWEKIKN